jgi:Holliday junction resolvasome RuvABC DNA-binding subunit
VRHADGSEYGQSVQPRALDTWAKVFSALRNLGFREREIRAVFQQLRDKNSLQDAAFDQLLRGALAQLRALRVRA